MNSRTIGLLIAPACAILAVTAGAQHRPVITESGNTAELTDCTVKYSVDRGDNWFIQLGAGIAVPLFENELPQGQDARRHVTATYNIGAGRWFTPYMGFRLSAYYGAWHWDNVSYSKARYASLNLDFMWDMCNSLGGVDADRPVSVIPFVGLGGTYTWKIRSEGTNIDRGNGKLRSTSWTLPVSAGIRLRARLCRYVDFFVEGRASFYGDNVNNAAEGRPVDINIQATGGFSFTIGGVSYRAYSPCRDAAYIASLNGRINTMRGDLDDCAASLAAAQAQLPCPEEGPADSPAPMMATVRFRINSAEITDEEMVNVFNVAQYLKENPSVNVIIRGYADRDTGTSEYNLRLSQHRAEAVRRTLTDTYGISPSRMEIEAEGSATQPYRTNDWNRIVIFAPGE